MSEPQLKPLFTADQISAAIETMAAEINHDYAGEELVLVCILKGSLFFTADLSRALTGPLEIEFLRASSYGSGTSSSGRVDILVDLDRPIAGRNVLIVEDIIDSGLTLNALREHLLQRQPKSLKICTLLNKHERREIDIEPDYAGFELESGFVVGYGLDMAERFRNLPDVCVMQPAEPARRGTP